MAKPPFSLVFFARFVTSRTSSVRRRSSPRILRPLLEVLEARQMLSGVTWQQQSNYDGQSAVNPDTRSMRGLALSSNGAALYDGFTAGSGDGTERVIEVSSSVNASYVSPNAIDPTSSAGVDGIIATTGNLGGQPRAVATDNRGYVYMLDSNASGSTANSFGIFNSSLTTLVAQKTTTSTSNSQLEGIAVQEIGNQYYLYITHFKGVSTIERWNVTNPAAPTLDTTWGPVGSNGILNLKTLTGDVGAYPNGITIGSDGTLYVAGGIQAAGTGGNARGDSVFKISADGTTLLAENTSVPGAMDLALYAGNVYVTEYGNVTDNNDGSTTLPIMELSQSNLAHVQTLGITSGVNNIQPHVNGTSGTDSGLSGIDINSSGQIFVIDQQYNLSNSPFQYDQILVSSPLDTNAPLVTNAEVNGSATPSPIEYTGATTLTVTGTIDDSTTGGSTIASAGFTVDGGATVYPMTVVGTPTNNGETENVTATVSLSSIGLTSLGSHSITIQGTDNAGNTGYSTAVSFSLQDTTAPVVSNVQVSPPSATYTPSGGTIMLTASVSDNHDVASASYSTNGGTSWIPMTGTFGGTTASVSSSFSWASAGFTTAGVYTLLVEAEDSSSNVSLEGSITFTISKATPSVTVTDGSGPYNGAAFVATDTVAGVGSQATPAASLEGVAPTLTYYSGTSASGAPIGGAPSTTGTYTVLASFAGSTDYTSAASSATFTISQLGPVLGVGGPGPQYVPAAKTPVLVAPTATLTTGDGAFANSKLVVTDTNGGANDRLGIQAGGPLSINGSTLRYNGTVIGSFSGGVANAPLTITFNGNVTQASMLSVVQHVTYYNVVTNPGSIANRLIDFQLTDGKGEIGAVVVQTVVYAPVPTLGIGGAGPLYVPAKMAPVIVAPTATLTTGDGEFANSTVTVTNTAGGANDRLSIQSGGALSVSGSTLRYNGTVIGSFSGGVANAPLTISFNGNGTQAAVLSSVQHVVFYNVIPVPGSMANRLIAFQLTDGLGLVGTAVTQTVVFAQVPVLGVGSPGPLYVPATKAPVAVAPSATLTTGDGAFANSKLVVTDTNGGANDRLSVQSGGLLVVSGSTLRYNGVVIGSFSGGVAAGALNITFNGNATQAAVLAVAQNVVYYNVTSNPGVWANRLINFQLTDGLGYLGAVVTQTVMYS